MSGGRWRVFNYFRVCRDRGGCVKTTEWTVGVHGVEAIYIFSQYSSHSSAVSLVERNTPSLIPLFPKSLSISLFFLTVLLTLFARIPISCRLVEVNVPVAGFDGIGWTSREDSILNFCRFIYIIWLNWIILLYIYFFFLQSWPFSCPFWFFTIVIILGSTWQIRTNYL